MKSASRSSRRCLPGCSSTAAVTVSCSASAPRRTSPTRAGRDRLRRRRRPRPAGPRLLHRRRQTCADVLRQNYREHVARTFALLGDSAGRGKRATPTRSCASRRSSRRPRSRGWSGAIRTTCFTRWTAPGSSTLTPHFAWDPFLNALGLSAVDTFNVTQAEVLRSARSASSASTALDDLKTYLRWHAVHAAAPYLSRALRRRELRLLRPDPARRAAAAAALEALRARWSTRSSARRSGQEFVARAFSPKLKERTLRHDAADRAGDGTTTSTHLAWMSAATKQQALEKLHAIVNKIGYPDSGATTRRVDDRARRLRRQRRARADRFESQRQLGQDRQAARPRRVGA